MEPQQFTDQ
ncbi:unnamed protein product, partial [Rotaria sordida]